MNIKYKYPYRDQLLMNIKYKYKYRDQLLMNIKYKYPYRDQLLMNIKYKYKYRDQLLMNINYKYRDRENVYFTNKMLNICFSLLISNMFGINVREFLKNNVTYRFLIRATF